MGLRMSALLPTLGAVRRPLPALSRSSQHHHFQDTAMRTLTFVSFALAFASLFGVARAAAAIPDAEIAIIPKPAFLEPGEGYFLLGKGTVLVCDQADKEVRRVTDYFRSQLMTVSGFQLKITGAKTAPAKGIVRFVLREEASAPPEGYRLTVTSGGSAAGGSDAGGTVLRGPDPLPAPPTGSPRDEKGFRCPVADPMRGHQRLTTLRMARPAPRRLASFLPGGVREALHRPPRHVQDEPVPLAPHR